MAVSGFPARVALRPSAMTALVARSFRLLARYFLSSFLLGALCILLPLALLALALSGYGMWIIVAGGLALYVAMFYWYAVIMLRVSYDLVGMRVAWRQVFRRLRGMLAVRLFTVSIAIGALWLFSLVPFSLVAKGVSEWSSGATPAVRALAVAVILLSLLPPLYIVTSSLFALPVVVLESVGFRRAIARSWQLVRGRRWEIAATYILAIGTYVLAVVLADRFKDSLIAHSSVDLLIGALSYLAFFPWFVILSVLLYYDIRVRKEFLNVRALQHQIT